LEPFDIEFRNLHGKVLSRSTVHPPDQIATAPKGTSHVVESKAQLGEIIIRKQTPHQLITVHRDEEGIWMELNKEIQFHTSEMDRSHRNMVRTPFSFARNLDKVLIIGGGDGLPAKEALRHPVKDLRQVELDGELVKLFKTVPLLRKISGDSFNNPRLNLMIGDGIQYVLDTPEKFDVIIDDAEFHITGQTDPSPARYNSYMDALYSKLKPGGILSYTIPEDNKGTRDAVKRWIQSVRNRVGQDAFKTKAPFARSTSEKLPELDTETYLYISNQPLEKRRSLVS
jgi:spermidine synthase